MSGSPERWRRFLPGGRARWCGSILISALLLAIVAAVAAGADEREIATRRATETRDFTDAHIIDGFLKVMFGAEFHTEGYVERIRKYEGPVRVFIDNQAMPDRSRDVIDVIADIGRRIEHLDIAVTADRDAANVIVSLIHDRDLARTIRTFYGRERARRIQHTLEPQCLSGFRKDESFRIQRSEVILVVDAGDFVFMDCAYEELLQALGPINDDSSVPWTMFNDEVQMGFFDLYDQYLMNILYDPRIRAGMTREDVRAAIPAVLPDVRAHVSRVNDPRPARRE